RVADRDLGVRLAEAADELDADILVDDEVAKRRAALAARADGAEQDRADREIKIRRRTYDHRVVAAELEQGSTEALRHDRRHGPAHPHAARRAHEGHARMRD